MFENISKAEFLNLLLFEKYKIPKREPPIILSQIEHTNSPDLLKEYDGDMSVEAIDVWLRKVEEALPFKNEIHEDVLFGILYSSDIFVKKFRSKSIDSNKVVDFYKEHMEKNKKYIVMFNKTGGGKIKITAPTRILTRFPPEPSGYLHIGHAKAAILNQTLAKNGELIIRIDDTNPEKEYGIYENAILEDLQLLGIKEYKITHSSDYFDKLLEYAEDLIMRDKAYVDDTQVEIMREERTNGIASRNRGNSKDKNLEVFRKMKEGLMTQFCLRAKISVDNPNKAMRDPVIYRFIDKPHHRTGTKYKIYPTYDFTVPILDSIEGITLSLRSNEYRDRNMQYYWFIEALELENRPKIHDFSRLCFENSVVSKRKMKYLVDNKLVDGWDDPRLCTIRGLKRAGMNMGALVDYIKLQGASQKTSLNSWDKIWAMNKSVIDKLSGRYSAVPKKNAVLCFIFGWDENIIRDVPLHRKISELGTKRVLYSQEILISQEDAMILAVGEEFTLMNFGNAIVRNKVIENGVITKMELVANIEGDFKATKNKISWISQKGCITVKLYEYSDLLKKENADNNIEDGDVDRIINGNIAHITKSQDKIVNSEQEKLNDHKSASNNLADNKNSLSSLYEQFNRNSKSEEWWYAENAIKDIMPGNTIQIERIGFYYCDRPFEFNLIPYTKQKRTNQ